jgi:hypothetical protein
MKYLVSRQCWHFCATAKREEFIVESRARKHLRNHKRRDIALPKFFDFAQTSIA